MGDVFLRAVAAKAAVTDHQAEAAGHQEAVVQEAQSIFHLQAAMLALEFLDSDLRILEPVANY
jgi:hypothetical protein